MQVARLAGIEADIVSKARLAGQHIEDKLQVNNRCSADVSAGCRLPCVLGICILSCCTNLNCTSSEILLSLGTCLDNVMHSEMHGSIVCFMGNLTGVLLKSSINTAVYMQVSFSQKSPAADFFTSQAVSQLKHVLFACNASMTTLKQAWVSLQETYAV